MGRLSEFHASIRALLRSTMVTWMLGLRGQYELGTRGKVGLVRGVMGRLKVGFTT